MLVGPWRMMVSGDTVSLPGMLAALGATACYGFGGLYMRRFLASAGYDSVTMAAMQMVVATALSLLAAPFTSLGPASLTTPVVLSMPALGVLGSGIVASQGLLEKFRKPVVASAA